MFEQAYYYFTFMCDKGPSMLNYRAVRHQVVNHLCPDKHNNKTYIPRQFFFKFKMHEELL